jgi:hypothetical protein
MPDPERPLLAELRQQIAAAGADLGELLALRWELARREFRAAVACLRRLAVALAAAGVMTLVALPLLLGALAESLSGRLGIARAGWLGIFGLILAAGGLALGGLACRHFRRHFTAMTETLEECREDLVWLREWFGRGED